MDVSLDELMNQFWPLELEARERHGQVQVLAPLDQGYFRQIMLGIGTVGAARGWMIGHRPPEELAKDVLLHRVSRYVLVHTSASRGKVRPDVVGPSRAVAADVDLTQHGIPSVVMNQPRAGELAAEHLLELGLRSLAFFGKRDEDWCQQRLDGFAEHVRERAPDARLSIYHKGDGDPGLIRNEPFGPQNVVPWLHSLPKPVGIFTGCDAWSVTLAEYCRIGGLRVPEDVALIGVDDDEFTCRLCSPPLSSVAMPLERLGNEVAVMIDYLMSGQQPPRQKVVLEPTGVTRRRSTDIVMVDDADVAAAIAMIRRNADRPLSVTEILRAIPVGQRKLERGFRRYLGRTMLQEIRRAHVREAERLLASTDLPVEEIASRSGFSSSSKLATAFREETGLTCSAYRSQFRLRPASEAPASSRSRGARKAMASLQAG
jgi:LacI family transcriptional regulator